MTAMTAMTRGVLLLRGVNVDGNNKVPMAWLRDTLSRMGREDVVTYLQSGNAVAQVFASYSARSEAGPLHAEVAGLVRMSDIAAATAELD